MTSVAGRTPAPDAPQDMWIVWASRQVRSREFLREVNILTHDDGRDVRPPSQATNEGDGYVIVLEGATQPEERRDGRPCAEPSCITRLSKYNVANRCFAHDRGPF